MPRRFWWLLLFLSLIGGLIIFVLAELISWWVMD